jgi:hypothetical protein
MEERREKLTNTQEGRQSKYQFTGGGEERNKNKLKIY